MPLLSQISTGALRFSKYISRAARKRLPMISKWGNKNFYKGKGGRKHGRLTSKGAFVVDRKAMINFLVPELSGFKLLPYVAVTTPKNVKI
eukprot:CAMPEP_0113935662 /NCGR_PEP_ID=MMETSP1339-20121228/2780_1 /TAXON_ID=94617 /ORGANISM="Fibrocapsa japonica" /LENGTH=89 /DNA_ID=CAMNT_0000937893 /DNA_START=24 /DNA_END=293 /DNA_ORIENTATION=+ /assembly_acc=CAM_ASM_000762